jgi:hypothetical protein
MKCWVVLFFLVSRAAAHVPIFAGLSPSAIRTIDSPHASHVSQALYGKLLPGQQLCLRAAGGGSFDTDFFSAEAGAFREELTFSIQCEGAAVEARTPGIDDGSYIAMDPANDFQYSCSTGGSFPTGNADTLTLAQKEELAYLYPDEIQEYKACTQGCTQFTSGTCTKMNQTGALAGVKSANGALCKFESECDSGNCFITDAVGVCRPPLATASGCTSEVPGKAEPFTQSAHHSVARSVCGAAYAASDAATSAGTFPITLSGDPPMIRATCPPGDRIRACIQAAPGAMGVTRGGIVVGRDETFSPEAMASFPLYAARLHGSYGNRDYVLPFIATTLVAISVLSLLLGRLLSSRGAGFGTADPKDGIAVVYALRQAAAFFLLASADASYHVLRVATRLQISSGEALELAGFMLVVVGMAHIFPMALCLRFSHTRFREPSYYLDILPVLFMLTIVDMSLFAFGTHAARVAIAATASSTLVLGIAMAWLKRRAAVLAVALAHLSVGLIFFLGSGYWIGPGLLGIALVFSLIWYPEQWWPVHCPCRLHRTEIRCDAVVL